MRQEIKDRIEKIKKGEVPEGYEKRIIGILLSDWKIEKLEKMGTFLKGKGISKSEVIDEGIPCIRYGEIYTSHNNFIKNFQSFISKEVSKSSERIYKDDVLFAGSGETQEDIGKSVAFIDDVEAYAGGDIVILRPNKNYNSKYFGYALNGEISSNQRRKLGQGHSVVHIYSKDIKNIIIPIPSEQEQQKIATILSTWDKAIELKEKLIEQKKEQKRGLMKKLLTGEVRLPGFEGEWKEVRLGEIGSFLKGKGISKSEVIDVGVPCIRYGEIYTTHDIYIKEFRSFISRNVASNSERIYKGDILFAGSGETQEEIGKSVAYINDDEAYAGGDIVILRPKKSNSIFLGYALNGELFNNKKRKLGQGQSVVHIYSKDLKEISIPLPELAEQEKIAEILIKSSQEIGLLEQELEALKLQKKGLMQLLLTGIVRTIHN